MSYFQKKVLYYPQDITFLQILVTQSSRIPMLPWANIYIFISFTQCLGHFDLVAQNTFIKSKRIKLIYGPFDEIIQNFQLFRIPNYE